MTDFASELLQLLAGRGYIHQLTDAAGLDALAAKQVVPGYIGFDATAPSLHVGSLVQIMMLRRLQQAGHKPIVVMGGGTTKVGDPSGKDESRRLLDDDAIAGNIASIRQVFEAFLTFAPPGSEGEPSDAILVDNADWLDTLDYIPFLRDYGSHFTINRMLGFDSVRSRLSREQPLTFLEFNYMILQAYDFLELSRRVGCRLQLGGSDQWGNIVNGIELARRVDATELFGLTTPLMTTADGAKMGKSVGGAVWLNADQASAFDYWQYWRNVDDRDVIRFLKLFTDLPLDEIARLASLEGAEINAAKKLLADAATALCRGADAALIAADDARRVFDEQIAADVLPRLAVGDAIGIVDALVGLGLCTSRGEARRLIKGGGARIAGTRVADDTTLVTLCGSPVRISAGKKLHGLLIPG